MIGKEVVTQEALISEVSRKKINFGKIGVYCVLIFWSITTFLPLIWVFLNSFKDTQSILSSSLSLPKSYKLTNYREIIKFADIGKGFINSLIISGSVIFLVGIFSGLASFIIARFEFRLKNAVKMFMFTSMLIPQFAVIIPNFVTLKNLNIMGASGVASYLALIIPQTASFINFPVLILSGFMASIPNELEEAAIIDGASIPMIFRKIILPLSIPAFATTMVITFLWSYNDLLLSLVYIPLRQYQPICVILSLVSNVYGTNYGAMMAAIIVTIIPVIILYAFSQEYVVKGLTAGAVKG